MVVIKQSVLIALPLSLENVCLSLLLKEMKMKPINAIFVYMFYALNTECCAAKSVLVFWEIRKKNSNKAVKDIRRNSDTKIESAMLALLNLI